MYYGKAHIAIEKGQLKKIHQKNKEHENEEVLEDDDEEEYDEQEFYFDEIIDKFSNELLEDCDGDEDATMEEISLKLCIIMYFDLTPTCLQYRVRYDIKKPDHVYWVYIDWFSC